MSRYRVEDPVSDIRALIVDDEPLGRRGIRQLLAPHRDITVVGECRDGREALRALDALTPSLVFLDIQMPGLNGFAVVRARGPERMPPLVFVTAFDEFAVQAFEARALDYLVKPVSKTRFEATLQHVRKQMQLTNTSVLAAKLRELLLAEEARKGTSKPDGSLSAAASGRLTRLVVPTATGQMLIDPHEIERVEADDYYSAIYSGGRRHLVRESLSALEAKLSRSEIVFVRVHRSAIVRLDRIREIISLPGGAAIAVMRDSTRVPISRRRRDYLAGLLRRSPG
jgi:two-component system LytT family response regulator